MTATPPATPAVTIEEVTPQQAAAYLENNDDNRNISAAAVDNLARLMSEGKWEFNGDAIRFDTDGKLLDGQHRCMAIVRSGVTISQQVVIRGIQTASQATMDQGRKRTASDVLSMEGYRNGNQIASVARLIHQWKSGVRTQNELSRGALFPLTSAEVLHWAQREPKLGKAAALSITTSLRALSNPKASGALWFLTQEADAERSDRFFELIESGAGLNVGDPVLTLRNYWQNLKVTGGRLSTAPKFFDAGVRAWNRFCEGGQMTMITQRLERAIPDLWLPPGREDTVNRYPGQVQPEPEPPAPPAAVKTTPKAKAKRAPLQRTGGTGSLFAER